jgi:phosphoheptose isomerase
MSNYQETIQKHLLDGALVRRQIAETSSGEILEAALFIARAIAAGGKLMLCGNGGSAADCQHMSAEFVSRLTLDFARPGIASIALTTDTSFLTAFANDCGYEGVFARQVQSLGKPGDVLLGISTSGRSSNVLRAFEAAREIGVTTVALTGRAGILADIADRAIRVPADTTQHIQEAHLAIEHLICHVVERELYPETSATSSAPVAAATGQSSH